MCGGSYIFQFSRLRYFCLYINPVAATAATAAVEHYLSRHMVEWVGVSEGPVLPVLHHLILGRREAGPDRLLGPRGPG